MKWKEILKFKQTGVSTLVSIMIYLGVAALISEYVLSRECPEAIQLTSLFGLLFYTIWQIKYIATFINDLFNLLKN